MINKSVLVSLTANTYREDTADEPIMLLTTGELQIGDNTKIFYTESLSEDLPPQKISLHYQNNRLIMDREGDYTTSMIFEKGKRFEGIYSTPYGNIEIAIYCTFLSFNVGEDGGNIKIKYQLDMNGQFLSMHDLQLQIILKNESSK